jgi:malate dehydrogenase
VLKLDYKIEGSEDINEIKGSDIVVITAGLARKPGMTREELLAKNAAILKDVALKVKELAAGAIVIVVTNPLDLMTHLAQKILQFKPGRVFGMGVSLDASRLANQIAHEVKCAPSQVTAWVIGSHGEAMIPLPQHSTVNGTKLDKVLGGEKLEELSQKTVGRGAEIVALLGSGSAYFAPSAAIAEIVRAVALDEKKAIGVCASLNGEYGISDLFLGVPCTIGKNGVEKILEFELSPEEMAKLLQSAEATRKLVSQLGVGEV